MVNHAPNLHDMLEQMHVQLMGDQLDTKMAILESMDEQKDLLKRVHEAILRTPCGSSSPPKNLEKNNFKHRSTAAAVLGQKVQLKKQGSTLSICRAKLDDDDAVPPSRQTSHESWNSLPALSSSSQVRAVGRARFDDDLAKKGASHESAWGVTKSLPALSGLSAPSEVHALPPVPTELSPVMPGAVTGAHDSAATGPSKKTKFLSPASDSWGQFGDSQEKPDSSITLIPCRVSDFLFNRADKRNTVTSNPDDWHLVEPKGRGPHHRLTDKFRHTMKFISRRNSQRHAEGTATKIVNHPCFDLVSAFLILISTGMIGIETDYAARNGGKTDFACTVIGYITCGLFTMELILRALASGRSFLWSDPLSNWNRFDTFMVVASLVEVVIDVSLSGDGASNDSRILGILKIVRIVRALRIGRILKYAHTFQQIAFAMHSSISTLFWVFVMVFLFMYCFAIAMCQASTSHIVEAATGSEVLPTDPPYLQIIKTHYNNVPNAILSMFLSMTGGSNWGDMYFPIAEFSTLYAFLFLFYIGLVFFGVLNIVTAVFVDSAMQSQAHYKDLMIQDTIDHKKMYTTHLKEVFNEIDADQSGFVNQDEVEYFLTDEGLKMHLDSIGICPDDARTLFLMLDEDESGVVNIDEFCEGCMRLQGEAKAYDIHVLTRKTDRLHKQLYEQEADLQGMLRVLGTHMGVDWRTSLSSSSSLMAGNEHLGKESAPASQRGSQQSLSTSGSMRSINAWVQMPSVP